MPPSPLARQKHRGVNSSTGRSRSHRRIFIISLVGFVVFTLIAVATVGVDFFDAEVVSTPIVTTTTVIATRRSVRPVSLAERIENEARTHDCELERRTIGQTPPDVMPVHPNAWKDCYKGSLSCLGFNDSMRSRNAKYCANGAANRAPFVDRTPLSINRVRRSGVEGENLGSNVTWCFSTSGRALDSPPCWTRPLLDALVKDGVWPEVHRLLRSDPWRVLVGWVPSRFMDKQPLGRKANGDVMYPPTRGKNATFYTSEYGSVWEAHFTAGNLPFVFQLVHRNALTVCVHERIHLEAFACTPFAGEGPIPIHVCGCRKCGIAPDHRKEVVEPRATGPLLSLYPEWKGVSAVPLLRAAPPLLQRTRYAPDKALQLAKQSGCVVADSAPWLFNTSVVPSFPHEGLHRDINALLRVQATEDGIVTVVIFNQFWIDHLHNYVYGFRAKAGMTNLIVATTDSASLQVCIANRLPCLDASIYAEEEEEDGEDGGAKKKGFSKKVTEEFSWVKPRIVIAVLKRGYHILLSDLDLTWNSNPLRQLVDAKVDIAHQCDTPSPDGINSGFYFARSKQNVIDFFQSFTAMQPQTSADQNSMRLFARYDHSHPVSHTCLPFPSFAMKCYFKVDNSRRVEHGGVETFRWRDHQVKPGETPTWTLLHATCLNGASEKVRYFRAIGVWALDELESLVAVEQMNSSSEIPFCTVAASHDSTQNVTSTGSVDSSYRIVHNVLGATKHSAHYADMIANPLYLQARH